MCKREERERKERERKERFYWKLQVVSTKGATALKQRLLTRENTKRDSASNHNILNCSNVICDVESGEMTLFIYYSYQCFYFRMGHVSQSHTGWINFVCF